MIYNFSKVIRFPISQSREDRSQVGSVTSKPLTANAFKGPILSLMDDVHFASKWRILGEISHLEGVSKSKVQVTDFQVCDGFLSMWRVFKYVTDFFELIQHWVQCIGSFASHRLDYVTDHRYNPSLRLKSVTWCQIRPFLGKNCHWVVGPWIVLTKMMLQHAWILKEKRTMWMMLF